MTGLIYARGCANSWFLLLSCLPLWLLLKKEISGALQLQAYKIIFRIINITLCFIFLANPNKTRYFFIIIAFLKMFLYFLLDFLITYYLSWSFCFKKTFTHYSDYKCLFFCSLMNRQEDLLYRQTSMMEQTRIIGRKLLFEGKHNLAVPAGIHSLK